LIAASLVASAGPSSTGGGARPKPGQIAILARTNYSLYPMALALRQANIPYVRMGRQSIWDEPSLQVMVSLFQATSNKDGIGIPYALTWAGVSEAEVERLKEWCGGEFEKLARLTNAIGSDAVAAELAKAVNACADRRHAGETDAAINSISDWMQAVVRDRLRTAGQDLRLSLERAGASIAEGQEALLSLNGSLAQRIHLARTPPERDPNCVVLATFHAAKGLQWDDVYLIDLSASDTACGDANDHIHLLEEERRAFYVAMTRPKNRLFLFADAADPCEFIWNCGFNQEDAKRMN